jgi:teichuronic acid biosynthesis glycosyltransferase TuaG
MFFNNLKNKENKKYKKIYNVIITIFVLIFFHQYEIHRCNSLDKTMLKIKQFENSYSKSFVNNFFMKTDIEESIKYREINENNILIDHYIYQGNEEPDISVIITVYNQANCFYKVLRSVQNQSLKNIEIIIIDDCSLDNTTEVIENYMKEDKRIKYLKNESNNGKIKSRSDGVRMAKGKYITIIDGDDALSHENILFNSLTIANMANLDVVEFRYGFFEKHKLIQLNFNLNNIKNLKNRIIYQPELTFKFVDLVEGDSINGFSNRCIWGKLIKNDVFRKVVEFIGPKYTEDYLLDYEDTIMVVALFRVAKSYYYMQELGYYKSKGECENPFPILENKKCKSKNFLINSELDSIKYLNFLLDISKNSEIENKLIYKELMALDHYKKLNRKINKNFSYVYSIINRINESSFYLNNHRKKINKIKSKLLKKESIIKAKMNHINNYL